MDPKLSFDSERLRISPFLPTDEHSAFLVKLYDEPLFIEGEGRTGIDTVEKARERIAGRFAEYFARNGYGNFIVSLNDSGKHIGTISLIRGKDSIITLPDIGFAIIAENSKGYATEAARATIGWLKRERGVEGVLGFCSPTNARSRRVQEKIGLEFRGVIKCYRFGGETEECCFISPGLGDVKDYGVGVPPPSP
ncbi:acyl-CoA N-acyltransferase [Auricularia subglabra TFB-10046 SS5]|nr:acyl-CoA N-acyltransferase [Auricularia subglabra TFB-10046 SS5]